MERQIAWKRSSSTQQQRPSTRLTSRERISSQSGWPHNCPHPSSVVKKKKKTRELKKSYWRRILFRLGRETLVNIRSAGHDHRHYGRLRADELGGPGARSSIFPRYVMARDALNVTKSHQRGFYRPLYCDATRRNFFSLAGSAAAVRERETFN